MRTLVGVLLLFACFVCVHVSALHHDELNALEMGGSMLEQPAATTSSSSAPAAASSQNQTQAAVAVNENAPPAGWTPPETLKERADRIQREVIARMHGNHTHHHHRHHRRHHHHGHHNSTRRHHHIGFEGQFEKGMPVIWAVTRQGRVLSRVNGVHRHAAWRKHKGPRRFRKVVQGPNGAVYALTPSGEVLRRANITAKHPSGKGWKKLIGNLRSLAVTKRGALWGTNARNRVFFKSAKKGSSWKKVRGARLTSIAAGGKKLIVGINKEGKLVIREGISKTNVTGTKWTVQKVDEPVLKRVAAGRKGQLWAIDHEGDIYYKRNLTAEWVKIEAPAKAKSIVVAADGGVAVVSRNFELFSRAGINTTKAIGKGKFWNKVPRSAKLHFTSVGVGPSLKPKKGSRLGKGKKHKKHHKGKKGKKHHKKGKLGKGRSRTFTLRFRQPKESWKQNKTATRVPKALAALIKIYKKRIKLVSVHRVQKADGTKSKKRSIATFKLFRHNATAVALDTKNSSYVPREISPRKALGKLKIALRNATRVAKYPALKYVDAASLMRIKRNGKAVLVTAPASHGRRHLPSNAAHSHKLKVSHIVFRNNVRFVFGASKNLTADGFQQLVLTKRAKGRKSQKWTMSNSGQIYFKNAEGERMCLETQKHARKGTSLKLVVCSTSRDDKQLFQYSHKNGFVRHMASGRCLTAGSKSPKKSHLIKLGKCRRASHKLFKRKADARQQFKFVASKHQPKKGKKRSLIPEFPDRNLTFYVEFDRAFETLPADFNVTLGTDLSRAVGIGKSRVRVKKLSAVTTATPQINTGALIKFKAAEDDSGDIYTLPAYKAVRRALNNTKSELRGRDTWHTAIFKTLKIVSQSAYPKADNTSSKIEFFLAPGNVLDGAFGGKPGAHLAIASRNPLSSSQKWFYNKLVGRVYIRVDDQKYCITTSKNATAGSSLRTKECLATDDDDIHRQQFTYSSATQSFVHRYSELCLELPSRNTAGGTRIRLAKCGPASNAQAWDFPASYPKHLRKALKKARAAEKKVEKAALKALEKQMRQEAKEKQEVENQKQKANEAAAAAKVAEQKRVAAKAERVKFMTLRKTLKKNHYERKVQRTAFGNSGKFSCRDLSNYFGITHAQSIGYHTPALYRAAWTAKKCSTKPLSCQELTDCYDFENMNENNAWALRNGFKPGVNNSDSFKFAPILVAQRYFGLFKHAKHAHGFHGANEHYVNGTNTEERHNHTHASHDHHEDHSHAREHSHRRQCKGFYPLDCQQMSDYYGISRLFAGTAPKCVQKKFKVLGCTTHPEQTCQILSNRFGLASNATDAPSNSTKSAKASKASSPRFMQLAADAVPAAATYIAPKEAQDAFETHQCKTKPEKCQTISDRFQTWAGHKGKASKDTYRQFLLRACTTRPRLSCAQLSDSFGFGSRTRHPKPEEHGQTVDTLGAASFAQHLALSNDTEPTSFMEVSSSMGYNTNSLRNAPLRKIPAAYFVQWTKQQCTTRPHKCQQLSNIYGISPNSRGAASKAIARSFTAVKKCATHPLLSCQELSNIYGLTTETAGFTAEYLQKQWRSQNCSTSISTCQELSDQYDLPNGEWASYAPKGVRAQFKAYQCKTSPLPTCQALSDYYFINHAQIDPSLHSEVGIADRLILAKYSRWGCHHQYRDCQDISNFYNIGRNAKGKIQTNNLTPSFARAIYEFRQCGTSPLPGNVPGTADQPTA